MKLLILGAGGHGRVVEEIAEDLGYDEIAFLDDNNPVAIGKLDDLEKFRTQYEEAFVAIGNNTLRADLIEKVKKCGYTLPTLIHPTAYVSRTTTVEAGTIIEPKAIINARCLIEEGCIISVGAVIDHDAKICYCSHINAGAVVRCGWTIESTRKVDSGEVATGYKPEPAKSTPSKDFALEYLRMTGTEVSFF